MVKDFPDEELRQFPVEMVSWDEAQLFLAELNKREKVAGWTYRLPKGAEWEYACRGGPMADRLESTFHYYIEKPTDQLLPEQANFEHGDKSLKRPRKVGSYQPNKLGLYDMHGNVWEWCDDLFAPNDKDPQKASLRVFGGGGWQNVPLYAQAAYRNGLAPSYRDNGQGLRVARVPVGKEIIAPPPPSPGKKTETPPTFKNSLGMEFVLVPKGKSWLGGGGGKPGDKEVEIKEDFYLGKYEVTQEEWQKVLGSNPSHFSRNRGGKDMVKDIQDAELKRFPVEGVSWDDAQLFLRELNKREKEAAWLFRLPREAEWEYACRGGPTDDRSDSAFDFYFDKPTNQLQPAQANFEHGTGLKRTCKVGSYKPNRLGLYDMHGNAGEWCDDVETAVGALHRVIRGGGCIDPSTDCRAACRYSCPLVDRRYNIGLRVARVPVGK